jgi:prepilin-type N-terminal cleavage/methylation domain-containing protein
MYKKLKNQQGFTLIEVLLVVAIIAILAGVVILAVNPTKQLGDARNATREENVTTILDAVYQYEIDNDGNLPSTITTTPTDICATGATSCTGLVDLSVLTNNGKYLTAMPEDPQAGTTTDTHYQISDNANGRITVTAPDAEQGVTISVTR